MVTVIMFIEIKIKKYFFFIMKLLIVNASYHIFKNPLRLNYELKINHDFITIIVAIL